MARFIAAVILLLLLNCVSFYITQQKSIEDFGVSITAYSDTFEENAEVLLSTEAENLIIENNNKFQIFKSFAETKNSRILKKSLLHFQQKCQYILKDISFNKALLKFATKAVFPIVY